MSLTAIIAAGTAIFSAVSSNKASKTAAKASKDSSEAAIEAARISAEASEAELDFAKEQYQDWLDVFGDVREQLSTYFEGLTPEFARTRGLEAFEIEKTAALDAARITLEQRGIATSGLAAELETDFAQLSATERARIRANAPREAAKEQLGFLTLGMGQNPAGVLSTTLQNQANQSSANTRFALTASGNAASAAGSASLASSRATATAVTTLGETLAGLDLFKSKGGS